MALQVTFPETDLMPDMLKDHEDPQEPPQPSLCVVRSVLMSQP